MAASSPNPALVTIRAARRLPRWALLMLAAAYLLPGVFGRDPWRNADLIAFGRAFIGNPDLVERLRRDAPLVDADPSTYYGGGARAIPTSPRWTPPPPRAQHSHNTGEKTS